MSGSRASTSLARLTTNIHLPAARDFELGCAWAGGQRTIALHRWTIAHGFRFHALGPTALTLGGN